ncbi:hypothetical protein [Planctomicrobium sp. SH664]|uniref:hypothetical protein n=1 Tax=Planctomicrobium sp. SH664 TaxID=3448125 RepID=UPI003F5B7F41
MTPPTLARTLLPLLLTGFLLSSSQRAVLGENFRCADAELCSAAETSRHRSALFWSGRPLPGNWSLPCPIVVVGRTGSGHGKLQLRFDRGEVFGWRMLIQGERSTLLNDVIPHEVDHAVRASLIRHPIERWLDEGCASLMESAPAHAALRSRMATKTVNDFTLEWLAAESYPSNAGENERLYCLGFSLVEFLLQCDSPRRLLDFQRDPRPIEERLRLYYGCTVKELHHNWQQWRTAREARGYDCAACGCQLHPGSPGAVVPEGIPVLTIWTAEWCLHCHRLRKDIATNVGFREELMARFTVRFRDVEHDPAAGLEPPPVLLPAFDCGGKRLTGYHNPGELLERLRGLSAPSFSPEPIDREPPPPLVAPPDVPLPSVVIVPPLTSRPTSTPPSSSQPEETRGGKLITVSGGDDMRWVGVALQVLKWTGIWSGTLATGGLGGLAIGVGAWLVKRRLAAKFRSAATKPSVALTPEGRDAAWPAPFPRQLDEARQLLELSQAEGRVGVLDTLRGLFLQDELDKLSQSADLQASSVAERLRRAIDERVEEVAPLTTQIGQRNGGVSGN